MPVEPPLAPPVDDDVPAIDVEPDVPVVVELPPVPAVPPTFVMSGLVELLHARAVNEAESSTPARVR